MSPISGNTTASRLNKKGVMQCETDSRMLDSNRIGSVVRSPPLALSSYYSEDFLSPNVSVY